MNVQRRMVEDLWPVNYIQTPRPLDPSTPPPSYMEETPNINIDSG